MVNIINKKSKISQKDINIATGGVENVIPDIGQRELEIDIEFGQQGITSLREKVNTAKGTVKNMLEGDLFDEDGLRALVKRNTSVFQENVERKDQGGILAKTTQPEDVKVELDDSITTPKPVKKGVNKTIEEFGKILGLKNGRSFLGQKSIITPDGKALPLATMLGEIRSMTLEEFEKLANLNIIVDKSIGEKQTIGKSTKTNL